MGRGSSVGTATRRGRAFPDQSRPVLVATQPTLQLISGLFPGVKAAEAWRWTPIPSKAEVKENYSYTSNALLGYHGLIYGSVYFYLAIFCMEKFGCESEL